MEWLPEEVSSGNASDMVKVERAQMKNGIRVLVFRRVHRQRIKSHTVQESYNYNTNTNLPKRQ